MQKNVRKQKSAATINLNGPLVIKNSIVQTLLYNYVSVLQTSESLY